MKWMLCLTTLALCGSLWAEPQQWNELGEPVALSRPIATNSSATNAEGFSLLVWAQSQGQHPVVLGQMIAPDGSRLWEPEGRLLATGLRSAGYPKVTAVDGGWVIAWYDAEYIEWCDRLDGGWCIRTAIHATKVDNDGAPLWPSGLVGVEIDPMRDVYELESFWVYPSGGGAIVTTQPGYGDAVTARGVSATGELWATALELAPMVSWSGWQTASDAAGGVLVAWTDTGTNDSLIYANRMSADGQLLWGDEEGTLVVNAHGNVRDVWLEPDGIGGAYLVWSRFGGDNSARLQRLDPDGVPMLAEAGVPMIVNAAVVSLEQIAASMDNGTPDGVLGMFLQNDSSLPVVQKLSPAGNMLWGDESGIEICGDLENVYIENLVLATDTYGGALVQSRLTDFGSNNSGVHMSRIAASGELAWAEPCPEIGTVGGYQSEQFEPTVLGMIVRAGWFESQDNASFYTVPIDITNGEPQTEQTAVFNSPMASMQNPQIVRLANGSTAMIWEQHNLSGSVGMFQIFDVFGQPLLADGGQPLARNQTDAPLPVTDMAICADGSGGFFALLTTDVGLRTEVRALHYDGEGATYTQLSGVTLRDAVGYDTQYGLQCVSDGNGGCFASLNEYSDLFSIRSLTMRINETCDALWPTFVTFEANNADIYSHALLPGANHSALLMTAHYVNYPQYEMELQQIGPDGVIQWTTTVTDSAYSPSYKSSVIADGQNGAYVIWNLERSGGYELRAQHVTAEGSELWPHPGILLRNVAWGGQVSAGCDPVGNLTVAFTVDSTVSWLAAQRITAAGELLWGPAGRYIHQTMNSYGSPIVSTISDNEVYIFWTEYPEDYAEYLVTGPLSYAIHLNARGNVGDDSWWEESGNPICSAGRFQRTSSVVADGMGGVVVAWEDRRTAVGYWNSSVFAQRLFDPIFTDAEELPVVPTEFALAQNYPNPFNPETVIEFALPTSVVTTLKVYDIMGREVTTLVDGMLNAGVQRVSFNAQNLASGVYFYQIRAGEFAMTKKMVVLK